MKKQWNDPYDTPSLNQQPDIILPDDPEEPFVPEASDPDFIPEEDLFESIPYENPIEGEGP